MSLRQRSGTKWGEKIFDFRQHADPGPARAASKSFRRPDGYTLPLCQPVCNFALILAHSGRTGKPSTRGSGPLGAWRGKQVSTACCVRAIDKSEVGRMKDEG